MRDDRIRYLQRKHAGRKDHVSFSKRRYERNLELVLY
jgi:hypothetical protein